MDHEVVAALIRQSGRVLLGLRAPERAFYPGVWDLFGGHLEPGERSEEALLRELQEELGITPSSWSFLKTLTAPLSTPPGQLTVHLYLVTAWVGTPANRQPQEHSQIGWFSLEQALRLPLADPIYPSLFERYLEGAGGPIVGQE